MDDSRIRSKTAPFSFENGLVWTGPEPQRWLLLIVFYGEILFFVLVPFKSELLESLAMTTATAVKTPQNKRFNVF